MANYSKSSSFHNVLVFVLAVGFGIVGLALAYKALTTPSDLRSRASQEERLVQGWEFDGDTTEGWSGIKGTIVGVRTIALPNKALVASLQGQGSTEIIQNSDMKVLPAGYKRIRIRMAAMTRQVIPVTPGSKLTMPKPQTPTPIASYPFNAKVSITGKKDSDTFTGFVSGVANGLYYQYDLVLPQTLPVNADNMQIEFTDAKYYPMDIWIDWIHMVITNPSVATPTPTSKITPVPTRYPTNYPTPYPTAYPTGGGCVTQCNVITKVCAKVCPTLYPTPTPQQPTWYPATPTPTPGSQGINDCQIHGGRCESLYAKCPTPDNQLPYDCGMGLRCIPVTMVCN